MKRYNYGINCQLHTGTNFSYVTPIGYFDVVPGDTMYGSLDFRYVSYNTNSLVMNRAFIDLYAFYVPYRLVWDEFPEFLTTGSGTLPTVTDVFEWNWEKNFIHTNRS